MMDDFVWKVNDGGKVKLSDYDPDYTDAQKDQITAKAELQLLSTELSELQELMWAAQQHSLLVVLQGMDTSGKDGTIRHVLSNVNPQGCAVHSFKRPTETELAHDFLWRVHAVTPPRGVMSIFNRSHYEDVLVVRVHNLVPKGVWSQRYQQINQFESLLTGANTIILKFFLHISKNEQKNRLLAREANKDKTWKLEAADWVERQYWKDYQEAYEEAIKKCSTKDAPWYIVPANHKWYRNLAIAHTLVRTMREYKDQWKAALEERGQRELALLKKLRASGQTE